jgi:hypothetical protein
MLLTIDNPYAMQGLQPAHKSMFLGEDGSIAMTYPAKPLEPPARQNKLA